MSKKCKWSDLTLEEKVKRFDESLIHRIVTVAVSVITSILVTIAIFSRYG